MFIREDKEIERGLEEEDNTMPPLKDYNEVKYLIEGEILITKHTLSMQI